MRKSKGRSSARNMWSNNGVSSLLQHIVRVAKWLLVGLFFLVMGLLVRSYTTHEWQGIETYRILWYAKNEQNDIVEMKLFQYLPMEQALVSYSIPADSFITVTDGYGPYQVRYLYRLAKQEDKIDSLILETVEDMFAYDVRASIEGEVGESENFEQDVLLQSIQQLWQIGADGNGYDLFRAWMGIRAVGAGKSFQINLEDQNVFESRVDVDGIEKRYISRLMIDDLINRTTPPAHDMYFDTQIVVVNTTTSPGLATQMGRLINHEGFDVVRVIDEPSSLSLDEVWFSTQDLKENESGLRIVQIVDPLITKVSDTSEYRSDVVVFLGKETAEQ